jgi:hypothetical protein
MGTVTRDGFPYLSCETNRKSFSLISFLVGTNLSSSLSLMEKFLERIRNHVSVFLSLVALI